MPTRSRSASGSSPSGSPRTLAPATTYVALVNAAALLVVTLPIIGGGVNRLLGRTPEIHGLPVLRASAPPDLPGG